MSYKIGEYMKEVYGVTDEEVGFLWDLYRERVKSKLNKFLEKQLPPSVFNTIIADLWERTVKIPRTDKPLCTGGALEDYDYWCTRCNQTHKQQKGGDQEGPYDRANLVVQLHLPSSEFPYNVETGRGRSWGQLNDYLTGQYGLTPEECQKVWDRYRNNICKNPQLPTLNESRDKQQELIQYVITTLLNETIIDKENSEVILPWNMKYVNIMANFAGIDKDLHNPALELNGSMAYNFWDMMENIYGLTDDEVERVWFIYGPTLSQRMHDVWFDDWKTQYYDGTILDEAEAKIITHPEDDEDPYSFAWHPEPKKRKFYEAILRDVVNDSTIEPDGVISVGDTRLSHQRGLLFHNLSHSYDVGPFLKHLRETYGLVRHETHPIWSRWEHIMVDKIKKWLTAKGIKLSDAGYEEPLWAQNDEEEINESKDKKKGKTTKSFRLRHRRSN